jgi:hypothetical protein
MRDACVAVLYKFFPLHMCFPPSHSYICRNLCLVLRWLKQIKKEGSSLEFRVYWDALDQQQRNVHHLFLSAL